MYEQYLENLNNKRKISDKLTAIVYDKFSINKKIRSADTSSLFSNLGYIIKGRECHYLELSKGDRTFIKTFIFNQIHNNYFNLKLIEAFPMFKEDIKNIVDIGEKLLELNDNENSALAFSRKYLNIERKTLESCWQYYFEKYLKIFFMGYKKFYSQQTFKQMIGYEKESRPDFLAVDLYNNIDVIEIKHHKTVLFKKEKGRDSYYPSHELNKSIFQLNKYLDLKSNLINTSRVKDKFLKSIIEDDRIYRPRGILIISSKNYIVDDNIKEEVLIRLEKEIQKLKTTYTNIDIVLFDELIESLKNYLQFMELSFSDNKTEQI